MKKNGSKVIIILLVIIIVLLLVFIGLMVSGKVSFSNNKDEEVIEKDEISYDVNDYISLEKVEFGERADVKKVVFKNLDEDLIKDFVSKQDDLINESKNTYEYNENNNFSMLTTDDFYVTSSDVWYQVNEKVLTVYYMMVNEEAVGSCPELITININLEKKQVISDEELLDMVGISFDDIALENYNKTLEVAKENCNDDFCGVQDKEYKIISIEEYTKNKDVYINMIKSGLEEVIFAYIENGKVEYSYSRYSIDMLYYGVAKGGCFDFVTVEAGNLK